MKKAFINTLLLICFAVFNLSVAVAHDSGIPGYTPYAVFDQTTSPTVSDDEGDGFTPGSLWVDTAGDKEYVCLDATAGVAVWNETSIEDHGLLDPASLLDNDHNHYLLTDCSNDPLTGDLEISKVLPELKLTDIGDGNSFRIVRTDTNAQVNFYSTLLKQSGPGNALEYGGVNECVEITNDSGLDALTEGTIVTFFKTTDTTSATTTLIAFTDQGDSPTSITGLLIDNSDSSKLRWLVRQTGSNLVHWKHDTGGYADGSWHMFAVTVDSGGTTIYIDGADVTTDGTFLSGSAASTNFISSTTNIDRITLGCRGLSGGDDLFFIGTQDQTVIWSNVKSANDISDVWNGGSTLRVNKGDNFPTDGGPMGTALGSLWHFDEVSGTSVADSSDNANTGTTQNMEDPGDWVTGIVPVPGSDVEISFLEARDGLSASEAGSVVLGNDTTDFPRVTLMARTTRFNILGSEVAQFDENGTLIIDNGDATAQQLILTAATGASENIFECQDGANNLLFQIEPDGDLNMLGNTIYGDTANSGDLTLMSTSHATKGRIIFNNSTTGLVYDGDDEAATIGGGSNSHDINGTTEKALWEFHQDGATGGGGTVYHRHSNDPSVSSDATWLKSSGDHATPTIVADGEQIGHLRFGGHDGTDYALTVEMGAFIDGVPGNNDMPGRWVLSVSPDGGQVPAEALRVSQDKTARFLGKVSFTQTDDNEHIDSLADGYLDYSATTAHRLNMSTADTDVRMEFVGTTNSGLFEWMEDEDYFKFSDDVVLDTGLLFFQETTTPTPIANHGSVYTKTDNHLYFQDGSGTEHVVHAPAFSSMWYHGSAAVLTIAAEDALTKIDTFINIGPEDDSGHASSNITNDEITLADEGGGEYAIGFGASLTATGASKELIIVTGVELATPLDITDVTDDTVSPIVITSTAHGLFDGDMVEILGVLGNTAANGSFMVDNKTANTFELAALDSAATTGNGDYNEGTPTGDVTIWYPGCMTIHAVVSQTTIQVISAPGTPIIELSESDKIALYAANLDDTNNLNISVVTLSLNRLDSH